MSPVVVHVTSFTVTSSESNTAFTVYGWKMLRVSGASVIVTDLAGIASGIT